MPLSCSPGKPISLSWPLWLTTSCSSFGHIQASMAGSLTLPATLAAMACAAACRCGEAAGCGATVPPTGHGRGDPVGAGRPATGAVWALRLKPGGGLASCTLFPSSSAASLVAYGEEPALPVLYIDQASLAHSRNVFCAEKVARRSSSSSLMPASRLSRQSQQTPTVS